MTIRWTSERDWKAIRNKAKEIKITKKEVVV
jgi:hypothetical protein